MDKSESTDDEPLISMTFTDKNSRLSPRGTNAVTTVISVPKSWDWKSVALLIRDLVQHTATSYGITEGTVWDFIAELRGAKILPVSELKKEVKPN